jgi:hypothetical protein
MLPSISPNEIPVTVSSDAGTISRPASDTMSLDSTSGVPTKDIASAILLTKQYLTSLELAYKGPIAGQGSAGEQR